MPRFSSVTLRSVLKEVSTIKDTLDAGYDLDISKVARLQKAETALADLVERLNKTPIILNGTDFRSAYENLTRYLKDKRKLLVEAQEESTSSPFSIEGDMSVQNSSSVSRLKTDQPKVDLDSTVSQPESLSVTPVSSEDHSEPRQEIVFSPPVVAEETNTPPTDTGSASLERPVETKTVKKMSQEDFVILEKKISADIQTVLSRIEEYKSKSKSSSKRDPINILSDKLTDVQGRLIGIFKNDRRTVTAENIEKLTTINNAIQSIQKDIQSKEYRTLRGHLWHEIKSLIDKIGDFVSGLISRIRGRPVAANEPIPYTGAYNVMFYKKANEIMDGVREHHSPDFKSK